MTKKLRLTLCLIFSGLISVLLPQAALGYVYPTAPKEDTTWQWYVCIGAGVAAAIIAWIIMAVVKSRKKAAGKTQNPLKDEPPKMQ